jgi:S1-C subfamily serine protease
VRTSDGLGVAVNRFSPGETIDVAIIRDGKRRTLRVELGRRPGQARP